MSINAMDESYKKYLKGRESFENGNYIEAIEILTESNNIDPHFKSYELIGEANINLGNKEAAVRPLKKATEMNKGVRAPSILAKVLLDLGRIEEANKYAAIGYERDANNKLIKLVLGKLSGS